MSDTPTPPQPTEADLRHARRLAWFKALAPVLIIVATAMASFLGVEGYQARSRRHELDLKQRDQQRQLELRANDALSNRHNDIINRYLAYHDDVGEKRLALARFMAHTGRDGIRVWAQGEVRRLQEALEDRERAKDETEALQSKLADVDAKLKEAVEGAARTDRLEADRDALRAKLVLKEARLTEAQQKLDTEATFALMKPLYDRSSGELTAAEVFKRRRLATGDRVRWNGVDLQQLDLSGIKLRRALLKRADLDHTVLVDVDLSGATLLGATLDQANLTNADLHFASLSRAYLREANFSGANLSRSRLSDVFARRAQFSGADLRGADLRGADLTEAKFTGADLRETLLEGAQLEGADLAGARAPAKGTRALPKPVRGAWKTCGSANDARFQPARGRCPKPG